MLHLFAFIPKIRKRSPGKYARRVKPKAIPMSLYVIADTHLSFGTDKPMDIFRGWAEHTDRLSSQWQNLVEENDTVVIPGDISWAMDIKDAYKDFEFLNSLPGTKLIGKGNHDYWWCTMRKMEQFLAEKHFDSLHFLFNNAYLSDGVSVCGTRGWFFDAAGADSEENEKVILREAGRLRRSLEEGVRLGGELTAFMHYPVVTDEGMCEPLFSVLKEYGVKRCYFGHIHGDRSGRYNDFTVDGIRFSLISADNLAFCPKKVIF